MDLGCGYLFNLARLVVVHSSAHNDASFTPYIVYPSLASDLRAKLVGDDAQHVDASSPFSYANRRFVIVSFDTNEIALDGTYLLPRLTRQWRQVQDRLSDSCVLCR